MCYARRQRSSWARIKLSNKLYIIRLMRFDSFELFILAFFTFLELCSLWFWQILFSHLLFCFVLLLSVVQLSSFNRSRFYVSLSIISPRTPFVKRFFKTFLSFFEWFFSVFFATALLFYHFPFYLSSTYLKFLSNFFTFGYFFKIAIYTDLFLCNIHN